MKNLDIREEANKSKVKLWEIAEELNISDNWFSRILRHELPEEKKTEIRSIIKNIASERQKERDA